MAKKNAKPAPKLDLPPGIEPADLEWGPGIPYAERGDIPYELLFYRTERFGWVLCTLIIGGAGKGATSSTARYYAIEVATEKLCRVGHGPHVLAECRVLPSAKNKERLARYFELHRKGMADAGDTRDGISTKRARTAMRRRGLFGGDW